MTDTTQNPRTRSIAPGVSAEMIAEQTHMFYDPQTGGGYVSFQAREHLIVGTEVQQPLGDFDILIAQIPDIMAIKFGGGLRDPVTDVDLSNVSTAGVMVYIKAAYDQLYAARDAARKAAAAAAEAAAHEPAAEPTP